MSYTTRPSPFSTVASAIYHDFYLTWTDFYSSKDGNEEIVPSVDVVVCS